MSTTLDDLKPGMNLPGIVTNVTAFGAFVDVGVHQDGLVHISELADRFVKDPSEVVKVQQKVTVRVLDVDLARKRIALSMKKGAPPPSKDREAPTHRGKARPEGGKPLPPQQRKPAAPFNNPFADLFTKTKN